MSFIRKQKKGDHIYLHEVENKRINGKVVQKYIRYIGKEVNGERIVSISSNDLEVDSVRIYGPLLVLHSIAKKIKLPEILGKYSNEILSMVYAHCLDYKSLRNMPKWYKRTDLNLLLNLDNLTESRLVSAMDSLTERTMAEYQRAIFKNVKKAYKIDSRGIVYDVTNTYFHGKKCEMGRVGRSKDGQRQNDLIQIGLATTQKEGIPVFHKTFKGNIHDNKTLISLSEGFDNHGLNSGLFVYDRGIVSEKNINFIGKLGWETLCGLPMREKEKNFIRSVLSKEPIDQFFNMIQIRKGLFYVKCFPYKFGSIRGKLSVCYNENRRLEIKQHRRKLISKAQNFLHENKKISEGLSKYLTPTGRLRKEVLDEAEEFDGYSCIFSTKNMPGQEMVRLYYDKDIIEKAFRTLKGVSNIQPVRFWLNNHVIAHVFICYLSYLLLSVLQMNLKSKNINMSPEDAIRELAEVYNVYLQDKKKKNKFVRTVTLSKIQEKILKTVDPKIIKKGILSS